MISKQDINEQNVYLFIIYKYGILELISCV